MFKMINNSKAPTRENRNSSHWDLYASESVTIPVGKTVEIGLGLCIDFEQYIEMARSKGEHLVEGTQRNIAKIKRSSFLQLEMHRSLKLKGLVSSTESVSLYDDGEVKIIIQNPFRGVGHASFGGFKINKGDKIAKAAFVQHQTFRTGDNNE